VTVLIFLILVLAAMRSLTVGVFHDEALGKELGKKGTLSDFAMYHKKADDIIFTFMSPVEEKLAAKSEILTAIDAAVVVFSQLTRELGETIIMLDLMGITEGIAVTTPYAAPDQIVSLTKGSTVNSFHIEQKDPGKLLELLKQINPARDSNSPVLVVVDHSFSVKGVGEVVLGFVKRGVVRRYDKLMLLPARKEVIVRSVQVQDEDWESAEAGTRVGLAIKGANSEELERGAVLTASSETRASTKLSLSFRKSSFYVDDVREGIFHATIGMQTEPVTLGDVKSGAIGIESSKSFVYEPKDTALMLDLNAKKTRVVGNGVIQ